MGTMMNILNILRQRFGVVLTGSLLMVLLVAWTEAPVTVNIVKGIHFGVLYRSQQKTISYGAPEAAQITLTGTKNRRVLISVSENTLQFGRDQLDFRMTGHDIAYSLNNGGTWKTFGSSTSEVLRFPKYGGGDVSTILLRIGGKVTVGSGQQRGSYSSPIVVSGEYLNSDSPAPTPARSRGVIVVPEFHLQEDGSLQMQ